MRGTFLAAASLTLISCGKQHGGVGDPIAFSDRRFDPAFNVKMVEFSQSFSKANNLKFNNISSEPLRLQLSIDKLVIRVIGSPENRRLHIEATGSVDAASIGLTNSFINAAGQVGN